ncbi:MAG TPA: hypothetical protein VFY06_12895 [Verrucomicrobiae bacterium]|nr:hypothetical protein [Verrucomicrobiae bacterium]
MKAGIKSIVAGAALVVLGVVVLPLAIAIPIFLTLSGHLIEFKVPGTFETNVVKTGRYYLYNDYQTIFNGKTYNNSKNLPGGMEIKILDSQGDSLPFTGDASVSVNGSGTERNSIGYVDLQKPGKVWIEVSGTSEERIFSFGQEHFLKLFVGLIGTLGLCFLFALGGTGLAVWGVIKLVRSGQ